MEVNIDFKEKNLVMQKEIMKSLAGWIKLQEKYLKDGSKD